MSTFDLTPNECHHCDVARRDARERYRAEGASDEWIKTAVENTLCRGHQAEKEERERRERRRLADQRRSAKQRSR